MLGLVTMLAMLAMLAGLLVVVALPAHADCAAEPEDVLVEQQTVFVATAAARTDRYARVEVEEVWRGPDLAPTVWLQTSAAELPPWPVSLMRRVATSVDAELVPGTRYLIATENGGCRTTSCLVAEASEPWVEQLAPEATRQPVASGATGEGPGILEGTIGIAIAVASIMVLPAGGWLTYRRFRAARTAGHDATVTQKGTDP